MKKELFTSAVFTFFLLMAFVLIIKPFHTDELSTNGLLAYALAAATISTIAVIFALIASWKWLKISEAKVGYLGRAAIGIIIFPQLIVGISLLNWIAFDCTWYQLLERVIPIARNIIMITAIVFIFDYIIYRTTRNKRKNISIRAIEDNIKSQQDGLTITGRAKLSDTVECNAKDIIYGIYDGYYTKVYYIADNGAIKTRDIPIETSVFVKTYSEDVPTLIQCHKKYAINTLFLEALKRNWFGKITIKLKKVKVRIPCEIDYLSSFKK